MKYKNQAEKEKFFGLAHLISVMSSRIIRFDKKKKEAMKKIYDLSAELNIDMEAVREGDVGGFVDAVDYGVKFDENFFLDSIKDYIKKPEVQK